MKKTVIVLVAATTILSTGAGIAAAAPGENELGSLANAPASIGDLVAQNKSVNGLRVITQDEATKWTVDGADFWTRPGEATADLQSFATWFSANIEPISAQKGDEADDWSWAEPKPIPGSPSGALSNHASGTAIDLNATLHPQGHRGTFTADQTQKIRAKIAEYHGRLVWGGDWDDESVDEMHIEYVNNPLGSLPSTDSLGR